MKRILYAAICLWFVPVSVANANFEATADEVNIDTKSGVCYFVGHVKAKLKKKTFVADKVVVYTEHEKPKKLVAVGNVVYSDVKNKIYAKCCRSDMSSVIFVGDVVIEGDEYGKVTASRLVYDIATRKTTIYSTTRVTLVFSDTIEQKLKKKCK